MDLEPAVYGVLTNYPSSAALFPIFFVHSFGIANSHADQAELIAWMRGIQNIPERIFLIHGEPTSLNGLRVKIKDSFGWDAHIPSLSEVIEITIP